MIKSKVAPGYNNPFTLAHISVGFIENEIEKCKLAVQYSKDIEKELGYLPQGCVEGLRASEVALPLLEEALEYKKGLLIKDPSKLDFYQVIKND